RETDARCRRPYRRSFRVERDTTPCRELSQGLGRRQTTPSRSDRRWRVRFTGRESWQSDPGEVRTASVGGLTVEGTLEAGGGGAGGPSRLPRVSTPGSAWQPAGR